MSELRAPPVLSTPDTHVFEDPTPTTIHADPRLSDQDVREVYEIARTAGEIRAGGWTKIALQFPDHMLRDAPRVFQYLEDALKRTPASAKESAGPPAVEQLEQSFNDLSTSGRHRLSILADTSYGACCVDEIAAEHVDAEVVVHYGRSCLSPTARLPVIYVFTSRPLPLEPLLEAFTATYPAKDTQIILMADIVYHSHIQTVLSKIQELGYSNIIAPEVVHDPSSIIPNRLLDASIDAKEYSLFHVSEPPRALLLTLSSRVAQMHIYSTDSSDSGALAASTAMTLRRRYALLTSLSTNPVYGILINTLSVRNYLPVITALRAQIEAAGKKSYIFVVGKVNAAKIANFSEIGGWVVVGCWESSLIENKEFWRPVITPFELGLALMRDDERIWTGEWRGDFTGALEAPIIPKRETEGADEEEQGDEDSDEESAPPEFDLRTGRYVSHTRPMRSTKATSEKGNKPVNSLIKRAKGELATINGQVSPGAEYLKTQRTWQGLGSDFHEEQASHDIEEGRSGVARGYVVGDGERR